VSGPEWARRATEADLPWFSVMVGAGGNDDDDAVSGEDHVDAGWRAQFSVDEPR
jgi:hypothetical protein